MKFDFWNNPLVVTSFRLRQRRSSAINSLVLYPMVLLLIGVAIPYFLPNFRKNWPQTAFASLMGIQLVISGLWAAGTTSASMRSEVLNQTLDFRRISCLTPRQILLGKLMGEPAMAFFWCISTFPLALLCWATGGVDLTLLLLNYLTLMTHTLMCGAAGLVVPLELKEDRTIDSNFPALMIFALSMPLPFIQDMSWLLYALLAYPFLHLLIALLSFHVMERQLTNSLYPMVSKRMSYLLLFLADIVVAAVLADDSLMSFGQRGAAFCLAHLIVCMLLMTGTTPWRETLRSWVWRFRGRTSWPRDSLVGDRCEATMVFVIYSLLGVLNLAVLVLPVAWWYSTAGEIAKQWPSVLAAGGMTTLLILSVGVALQWFMLIFGKGGNGPPLFFGSMLLLVLTPQIVGLYPGFDYVLPFSVSGQFVQWFTHPDKPYNLGWILLIYGSMLVLAWRSLRYRMSLVEQIVDRKLERMGVCSNTEKGANRG